MNNNIPDVVIDNATRQAQRLHNHIIPDAKINVKKALDMTNEAEREFNRATKELVGFASFLQENVGDVSSHCDWWRCFGITPDSGKIKSCLNCTKFSCIGAEDNCVVNNQFMVGIKMIIKMKKDMQGIGYHDNNFNYLIERYFSFISDECLDHSFKKDDE